MATGIIKRYDFRKGFGFISDDNGEDFFFHKSEWQGDGPIRQGIPVKFVDKDSDKGPQAESVIPLDGGKSKPSGNKKPAVSSAPNKPKLAETKPASLEDRIASLESSVNTSKILCFLALAGVIILAVERFLL